jgi:hypothetical protein
MKHLPFFFCLAFGLLAGTLCADTFYLRGTFNGYNQSLVMTDLGGGVYEATATGLTPGSKYRFLAANANYTIQSGAAFEDVAAEANSAGEIRARFYSNLPSDGWRPNLRRLGILDLDYTYELMGSFNGYSSGVSLSDNGGILETTMSLAAATDYQFLFRKVNDWNITIKENFGDSGPNIAFTTAAAGDYLVQLDLTNGRYNISAVPEPSSLGLASLLGLAVLRRGRRSN